MALAPSTETGSGRAFYQMGEVHRLFGKFAEAEEAYHQAIRRQSNPGPGLALLRLAQGQVDAANAAIRRIAEENQEPGRRARVLDAYVEIVLAVNDVVAARSASDELTEIAARHSVPFLHALSFRASGTVFLAEGDPRNALAKLKQSWNIWCDLELPYEASRTRVLMALACRKLGDEDNARLELTAARQTFQQLGAAVDLARVKTLLFEDGGQSAGPLTERELQVLRLVASGMTNRGIAGKLRISEKTVARHLSNIFTKLAVSSRTAATAYAYDLRLL